MNERGQYVVHGSGGNDSGGDRRTYVVAFRPRATVAMERRHGFTHSHNDEVNWDTFQEIIAAEAAADAAADAAPPPPPEQGAEEKEEE